MSALRYPSELLRTPCGASAHGRTLRVRPGAFTLQGVSLANAGSGIGRGRTRQGATGEESACPTRPDCSLRGFLHGKGSSETSLAISAGGAESFGVGRTVLWLAVCSDAAAPNPPCDAGDGVPRWTDRALVVGPPHLDHMESADYVGWHHADPDDLHTVVGIFVLHGCHVGYMHRRRFREPAGQLWLCCHYHPASSHSVPRVWRQYHVGTGV